MEPVSAPVEAVSPEAKYIIGRSKELLAQGLDGVPSSAVSDADLAQLRAHAEGVAAREWRSLVRLLGIAEAVGQEKGEVAVYRRAADIAWPMFRDWAAYEDTPQVDEKRVREILETTADEARLEARIGR